MLEFIAFGLTAVAMLTVVGWSIVKLGAIQRLNLVKEQESAAARLKMSFDPDDRASEDFLKGFNLIKWGYSSSVRDVFQFQFEGSDISIGQFNYRNGKSGGSTTFFLIKNSSISFRSQHFIEPRGLIACWFQKEINWIPLLPETTREILFKYRWEIETQQDKLLVYRLNYSINQMAVLEKRIEVLKTILPSLLAAAGQRGLAA
ncbi:MAG: hypothetical protein AAGA30_17120 [Planctomycetota bacterium]